MTCLWDNSALNETQARSGGANNKDRKTQRVYRRDTKCRRENSGILLCVFASLLFNFPPLSSDGTRASAALQPGIKAGNAIAAAGVTVLLDFLLERFEI